MSENSFTGRAHAYVEARPGYPPEAVEYIADLASSDAVFADIGAGTGKFSELLARGGRALIAIELNADMREQLEITLAPYANAQIINGSAEATTLAAGSVDVVISAQALNWFDIEAYKAECKRIGRPGAIVVTLYNFRRNEERGILRYTKSTGALYRNPIVREFPNPIDFTRERFLAYHSSMSGVPGPGEPGYDEYFGDVNGVFDRESAEGMLRLELITKVFYERIDSI